ncbi:fungal-specific transcription factor domain-containing protein [Umbelopsis sp. AD052]|nr:fungal-specific transcription factor domain-containing protein [Umbelopsis sp. AD052]
MQTNDPKRRSKSGCLTCRARRVKCDTRSGVCGNCSRLHEVCRRGNGPVQTVELTAETMSTLTKAGTVRRRTIRSCLECRNQKRKCSGGRPACNRCAYNNLQCTYTNFPARSSSSIEDTSSSIDGSSRSSHQVDIQQPNTSQPIRPNLTASEVPGNNHGTTVLVTLNADHVRHIGINSSRRTQSYPSSKAVSTHAIRVPISSPIEIQLPDKIMVRMLVERFFSEIYPSRMFGFLHKPTFIFRLDEGHESNVDEKTLLLTICALATKNNHAESPELWEMGSQWANHAQQLLMASTNSISISNLMSVILLHEHESRVGKLSTCFLLTGLAARMSQALQINLEYDFDVLCSDSTMNCTEKECRRRLMWACYLLDSMTASGVKQLQLIDESDIKIQLPCSEDNFLFERPCITETVTPGETLKFANIFNQPISPTSNMDYRAYMIRIVYIRNRVLKYVKRFMEDEDPWLPTSEFSRILSDLMAWKLSCPSDLALTPSVIFIRKEQGLLLPLFQIQILYHLCFCDIFRIVMPGLSYPKTSSIEAIQIAAPVDFIIEKQDSCYQHACDISDIFQYALYHLPEEIGDPGLAIAAHEATRIQIVYTTDIAADRVTDEKLDATVKLIEYNVMYLQAITRRIPGIAKILGAVEKLIQKSPLSIPNVGPNFASRESSPEPPGDTAPQISPEYKLHPLSNFSAMRESIREKHAPQTARYASSSSAGSPAGPLLDISLLSSMIFTNTEDWLLANQQGVLF